MTQEILQSDLFNNKAKLEDEIRRLTDLNQRLMAVAKELGRADDSHEWDDAWSKMCKLFKEVA